MPTRDQRIQTLFDNMSAMKRGMHGQLHSLTKQFPVSRAQLELLSAIRDLQPVSFKDLASHLYLTPGAISQMAEGLEDQAFIERRVDPLDRRTQHLQVSAGGTKLLQEMERKRRKLMEAVLAELSDEELEIWIRVQEKMIRQFKAEHAQEKSQEKSQDTSTEQDTETKEQK